MALRNILISIGDSPNQAHFVIKGNLQAYLDVSVLTGTQFHVIGIESTGWDLVLNIITPESALLESGSFQHLKLREKNGNRSREVFVPLSVVPIIKAAVAGQNGLSVDGIVCGSISYGLKRVTR